MAKIYGKGSFQWIRHPITGQRLTVGNTNAGADVSFREAQEMPDYEENPAEDSEENEEKES